MTAPIIRVTFIAFFIFIECIIFSTGKGNIKTVIPSKSRENESMVNPIPAANENVKRPIGIPNMHTIFMNEKSFENFS